MAVPALLPAPRATPATGVGGRTPLLRRPPGRFLIALLLVAATVGWRRGQYFTGSLDPVVLGKAAISGLALLLALLAATAGPRARVGTGTLWLLAGLLAGSVFGALTAGGVGAAGAVAVRVAVVAVAVFLLLRSSDPRSVLLALAGACGVVAAVATVTGLRSGPPDRLAGGLPALSPNELALLAGVVVLVGSWRVLCDGARWPTGLAVLAGLAVVWATGSRTGLAMLLLGVGVVVAHVRRLPVWAVVSALVGAAAGSVVAVTTGLVSDFAGRDGDGAGTLESRMIAWDAARSWAESGWQVVFGGGLSVKVIRVRGQWWTEQPLDSSWVSLLVQAGVLGLLVALVWVLWTASGARRTTAPERGLLLGLLAFLVGRSLLESGLFDATPAFLLFTAVSLAAERASRSGRRTVPEGELP